MRKFEGFSKETLTFFEELQKNNSRQWFEENREIYERVVLQPAKDFVEDMGEVLQMLDPAIQAIPKVNKSLFRINRDTRFSSDKSPYKTNLGIWFWSGERKRMECSGFYFHLEGGTLMFGAGIYRFSKELLTIYRNAAAGKHGKKLMNVIENMRENGFGVGDKLYKRVPKGYDVPEEQKELMLYGGLHCGKAVKIPEEFFSDKLIDYSFSLYKRMVPFHDWLKSVF